MPSLLCGPISIPSTVSGAATAQTASCTSESPSSDGFGDTQLRTSRTHVIRSTAETFVVGTDGVIRYKFVGPLNEDAVATRLMPEIEKAMGGSASTQ